MWTQEQMRDFVRLVRDMRHYQREFFRTHDQATLRESKRLEHIVDRLVKSFGNGEKELFPYSTPDTPLEAAGEEETEKEEYSR